MDKFTWGRVMCHYEYDFDGQVMRVVKYHPWKCDGCNVLTGQPDLESVQFSCKELHQSCDSLQYLLISWMAYKNLGFGNNDGIVGGIARALKVPGSFGDGEPC